MEGIMENKFKYVDCWKRRNLSHKNVNIEIAFREPRVDFDSDYFKDDAGNWAYYLIVRLDWIKDENFKNKIWLETEQFTQTKYPCYNYRDTILADLPWHCGITYYEKKIIADANIRLIKMGCDYQHYWDEGHTYTKEIVLADAIETAEAFLNMCPNYGPNNE